MKYPEKMRLIIILSGFEPPSCFRVKQNNAFAVIIHSVKKVRQQKERGWVWGWGMDKI